MIIQCEKCRTRFRLDDSRVKDKGVKVRCTKCKNIFRVQKEATVEESSDQQLAAIAGVDSAFDSDAFDDTSTERIATDLSLFETSPVEDSVISFETDDYHVPAAESAPSSTNVHAAMGEDVDFSSFDFGDINSEPVSTVQSTLSLDDFIDTSSEPETASAKVVAPPKGAHQGLDFSDDDMFGAVVQPAPEELSDTITFDFEGDSFAESMDMSGQDSSSKSGTLFSLGTPGDAPFNLGEIDFGDELTSVAVQQVNPEDLQPSQEILFAPLAKAQDKTTDDELLKQSFLGEHPAEEQQELPPLSISSRRKHSPLFGGVIATMVLLTISIIGYLGYTSFSTPKDTVSLENGKISIHAVKPFYILNDQVGELLVISGEALNEFSKQRASLQVKATVFDSAGQSVAVKSAYGGNPLTEEQLKSLPLDKIEAAMANQFGDSLANMDVAPGKSIPFVVVLANLPKGAVDFVVQPVGSTVAAGRQQ